MSRVRRALLLAVFGLFLLTLLLRPITRLVSRAFTGDGFDPNALLVAAPGVVVLLVMLVVVARVLRTGNDASVEDALAMQGPFDQPRGSGDGRREQDGSGQPSSDSGGEHRDRGGPSVLSGQGGTRNRGFEIEEEPPETELDDHMEYLQERLDEDALEPGADDQQSTAETGAEDPPGAATEHGTGSTAASDGDVTAGQPAAIPDECPRPYCDAQWEGGLFGGENYELLDGEQVRCEECDGITALE